MFYSEGCLDLAVVALGPYKKPYTNTERHREPSTDTDHHPDVSLRFAGTGNLTHQNRSAF